MIAGAIQTTSSASLALSKTTVTTSATSVSLRQTAQSGLEIALSKTTTSASFSSLTASRSSTLSVKPAAPYTLLSRLSAEGRLGELGQNYTLVDRLKSEGRLIDRGTIEGIVRLIDEQKASFAATGKRGFSV